MSVGVYIGIVYIVPTIGGLYVSCCFHHIVCIMLTIGGIGIIFWMSLGPLGQCYGGFYVSWCLKWYCIYHANNWGDVYCVFGRGVVCQLVFTLVLHISCQQLGGCM